MEPLAAPTSDDASERPRPLPPFSLILLVALAGAIGALARWGLASWVQERAGDGFPWGVLAANVVGAFLFGLVFALATDRGWIGERTRVVLLTGFLGAFTTFSTLAFDTTRLLREAEWFDAAANYLGHGVAGIVAVLLGMALGRWV
jgi:CrcB protein